MKLKTAKIVIEPLENTNRRWEMALKGKVKAKRNTEVITLSSWEILDKLLSSARLQILVAIPQLKPKSIAELARGMGKNFKNVYSDVKFLADIGLIDLKEKGPRGTLVPVAKYGEIELPFAA